MATHARATNRNVSMDACATLAEKTIKWLRAAGVRPPPLGVVVAVLNTMFLSSLRTEEGRPSRSSVTFASAETIDAGMPQLIKADFPKATALDMTIPFNVAELVKLSRAVDPWVASALIYGKSPSSLRIWGICDQLVHRSVALYRERRDRVAILLGLFTVDIDGIGEISVFHSYNFIGSVRQGDVLTQQTDPFGSTEVLDALAESYSNAAYRIETWIGRGLEHVDTVVALCLEWENAIYRVCLALKRLATGGSLVITDSPMTQLMSTKYPLQYTRLEESVILSVLHKINENDASDRLALSDASAGPTIEREHVYGHHAAQNDLESQEDQETGAVRQVAAFASLDGAVLMTRQLRVLGFGVKLLANSEALPVYSPAGPRGKRGRLIDVTQFGTRHLSVMKYCSADPGAMGIVVSQDGHVRFIQRRGDALEMWDNVRLQDHQTDPAAYRTFRRAVRELGRAGRVYGYTKLPQTLTQFNRDPER